MCSPYRKFRLLYRSYVSTIKCLVFTYCAWQRNRYTFRLRSNAPFCPSSLLFCKVWAVTIITLVNTNLLLHYFCFHLWIKVFNQSIDSHLNRNTYSTQINDRIKMRLLPRFPSFILFLTRSHSTQFSFCLIPYTYRIERQQRHYRETLSKQ